MINDVKEECRILRDWEKKERKKNFRLGNWYLFLNLNYEDKDASIWGINLYWWKLKKKKKCRLRL